jgi:elongation factor P
MITPNDFRFGTIIKLEDGYYQVIEYQRIKIAQRRAFVKTKLKNLITGQVIEKNFDSDATLEEVELERKKGQFLYCEGDNYYFMDLESYETIFFPKEVLGDRIYYLTENLEVVILYLQGKPVNIEVPTFVVLQVVETQAAFKGDTQAGSSKPAKLSTGLVIDVPFFVEVGDYVRIDTRTNTYVERVL